jgi:prepilin-type processing-associated H-X9-DG protein
MVPFRYRKDGSKYGVRLSDVLDGLSHTAAFSERAVGDGVVGPYTPRGDAVRETGIDIGPNNLTTNTLPYRNFCLSNTSTVDVLSTGGQNWAVGQQNTSLYNHCMTPNSKTCVPQSSPDSNGTYPATSYHPGGVNVLMADSSTRFVSDRISWNVWWFVGGRKDGEAAGNSSNM